MSKEIRQIHPFGPPVGKWSVHGTVGESIRRELKRLKDEADRRKANEVEAARVVTKLPKAKP